MEGEQPDVVDVDCLDEDIVCVEASVKPQEKSSEPKRNVKVAKTDEDEICIVEEVKIDQKRRQRVKQHDQSTDDVVCIDEKLPPKGGKRKVGSQLAGTSQTNVAYKEEEFVEDKKLRLEDLPVTVGSDRTGCGCNDYPLEICSKCVSFKVKLVRNC